MINYKKTILVAIMGLASHQTSFGMWQNVKNWASYFWGSTSNKQPTTQQPSMPHPEYEDLTASMFVVEWEDTAMPVDEFIVHVKNLSKTLDKENSDGRKNFKELVNAKNFAQLQQLQESYDRLLSEAYNAKSDITSFLKRSAPEFVEEFTASMLKNVSSVKIDPKGFYTYLNIKPTEKLATIKELIKYEKESALKKNENHKLDILRQIGYVFTNPYIRQEYDAYVNNELDALKLDDNKTIQLMQVNNELLDKKGDLEELKNTIKRILPK